MSVNVFKRYELKYILSPKQYSAIKGEIAKRLYPDVFGESAIQSLYYDTDDFRLIRASVEKPIFKEKLRLRCYNLNDDDRDIYVEMKRKYNGVVYKRRIACKENRALKLFCGEPDDSQIGKELDYFIRYYGEPEPKMLIIYDREAFYDKIGDLRVTFDKNVRYRTTDLNFHTSLEGEQLLPGYYLMELKTATALPLWLCRSLFENDIKKQSFSKYGKAYETEYLKSNGGMGLCLDRSFLTEQSQQSVSLSF